MPRRAAPIAASSLPLYRQIANRMELAVRRRALSPGDRLPSVRQLGAAEGVSVPTAHHVYATLEASGVVEARPRSGFFVAAGAPILTPRPPADRPKVSDLAATEPMELVRSDDIDPGKVNLGAALPHPDNIPAQRLARIAAGVARRLGVVGANYGPAEGPLVLRRQIARRSLIAGFAASPEDFCVTYGATEAVALALRCVCVRGDTVAVETPTFFGLLRQLRESGLKALPIPLSGEGGIDLDVLRRSARRCRLAAILTVPNFHNPTGGVMPTALKQALVAWAEGEGIPVIEDDVYGDLPHEGGRPSSLKAYEREGGVIHCSGFSKSIAPGYRVGFIAAGRWHARAIALKRASSSGNAVIPAVALAEFLADGGYDRYLRLLRQRCRDQVRQMAAAVFTHFPAGTRLSRPTGGFVLWCELAPAVDALHLYRRAHAADILIAPGPSFSSTGAFGNFIRLGCGAPWSGKIEAAVKTLGRLVRES